LYRAGPRGSGLHRSLVVADRSGPHRLLMVAHTEHGERIRIISARPLTPAEREAYEEETNR
jgi:hypothetical protein